MSVQIWRGHWHYFDATVFYSLHLSETLCSIPTSWYLEDSDHNDVNKNNIYLITGGNKWAL